MFNRWIKFFNLRLQMLYAQTLQESLIVTCNVHRTGDWLHTEFLRYATMFPFIFFTLSPISFSSTVSTWLLPFSSSSHVVFGVYYKASNSSQSPGKKQFLLQSSQLAVCLPGVQRRNQSPHPEMLKPSKGVRCRYAGKREIHAQRKMKSVWRTTCRQSSPARAN